MWTALSAAYPDATIPDLTAGLDEAVVAELRKLLARWLDRHWPALHTVPGHLADTTSNTDAADGPD